MSRKSSKRINATLKLIPYALFAWVGNRGSFAFRTIDGDMTAKINGFFDKFITALTVNFLPSINPWDLGVGLLVGVGILYVMWDMRNNRKKIRHKKEHGSAEWGTPKDIEPFIDFENFDNNVLFTQTERLTLGSGKGANDRNKNTLVIGGSGTGKTLFVVKPNIMQMHSCYVVTDPKGSVLDDCGKMLQRGGYDIKVFNLVDTTKSMHYNPFAYFRKESLQEDYTQIHNRFYGKYRPEPGWQRQGGRRGVRSAPRDFWNKAEVLLYTAYIALIFTLFEPQDRNIKTLVEMVTLSQASEDGNGTKSHIDMLFEATEKWLNGQDITGYKGILLTLPPTEEEKEIGKYAINYYKRFKQAAGKTMKSILISCSSRLSMFDIKGIGEITEYDDLELDKLDDRKTALFIITSDTNTTFNFLAAQNLCPRQ